MDLSFYNYIIQDLVCSYFRDYSVSAGRRFYIVIENSEYRDGFMDALKAIAKPCMVSGIYSDNTQEEEPYNTYEVDLGDGYPSLLIGRDSNASEDYLTTMRNAVGVPGSHYENYCLLFVLANSSLSSIVTSCQNLQGVGAPLSPNHIISNIRKKAYDALHNDNEFFFLDAYLNDIASSIDDGTCSLFDFRHALTVLDKHSLKGHYADLEFFHDDSIYENFFALSKDDMLERVKENHYIFRQISDILNDDDNANKVSSLSKFLDEKLSKKLVNNERWHQTSWKDIEESIERRSAVNKAEVRDVKVIAAGKEIPCAISPKGGRWKRYLLAYAEDEETQELTLHVHFDRHLKKDEVSKQVKVKGDCIFVPIPIGKLVTATAGGYEFSVLAVPCPDKFFLDIESDFTFNKEGAIVVKVPAEVDEVIFGRGDKMVGLPLNNTYKWEEGSCLEISILPEEEQESIDFALVFGETEIPIKLKLNSAAALLPMVPAEVNPLLQYWGENYQGNEFARLFDGTKIRTVNKRWRWYLENEKRFIDTGLPYLECATNVISGTDIMQRQWKNTTPLALPHRVNKALQAIFALFRKKSADNARYTVPSLTPPDEELEALYDEYCQAVLEAIRKLPTTDNKMLTHEEYNLTHLGIVKDHGDSRLYLSPFHPIMVAYHIELRRQMKREQAFLQEGMRSELRRQLSPFYLIPYLSLHNTVMRPVMDERLPSIRTWSLYEESSTRPQVHINAITTKEVADKMQEFIKHFPYLFQSVDCPIIIGAIGFADDSDSVKGILHFISNQYKQKQNVQRIELHEYVDNLTIETFFEKLNRLNTTDAIIRELGEHGYDSWTQDLSEQQFIHYFFTRVSFYKHCLDETEPNISYCHVAFYRMATQHTHVPLAHEVARTETAMNGLISATSTALIDNSYFIGFGSMHNPLNRGSIYPMAAAMNTLYANETNQGKSLFSKSAMIAKHYSFKQSTLLENIYDNANWVTFINPEVDINFFYNQKLYIVHYADQGGINAKFDSITVTKHIRQYENILRKSYDIFTLDAARFRNFNERMMSYFNCLNGSWMLSLVNKTEVQIREKMSIVAATIVLSRFMRRIANVIWVPVSLEEVLRVTGAIRLPMEHIFSKKSLGASGSLSDDLLMIGLHKLPDDKLNLYFYPVEVKCTKNGNAMVDKGGKQVSHTYKLLRAHIIEGEGFIKDIYRTFFASIFLSNSEKLAANGLMSRADYEVIEELRYRLLNSEYHIESNLPSDNGNIGKAAVIAFHSNAEPYVYTTIVEDEPICEIHFSEKESFRFVADPESANLRELDIAEISDMPPFPDNNTNMDAPSPSEPTDQTPDDGVGNQPTVKPVDVPGPASDINPATAPAAPAHEPIRILIGHTIKGKYPITFEPGNTAMVSHPNMGIIGTMGTGKTQFASALIAQLCKESAHNVGQTPIGILVFDYKGDYKGEDFLTAVDGKAYKYNFPFNPLKLVKTEDAEGMNLPAITADRISDSFSKAYGLGQKQQSIIKKTILDTYADAGIDRSPSTWDNPPPTMSQVIDKYFAEHDANDKCYALFDKLRDYTIFAESNEDCVSLFEWLDRVQVIDLTLYPDDTKKVIVSLILDLFYAEMRQLGASRQENGHREIRAMIMVDEAHQFLKKDFSSLRNIISEGRMFGVGMILSTQNIGDFKTSKEDYSQFILSWVIHHVNSISRSELASIFSANDPNTELYMRAINKAKIFESICKIGDSVNSIRDVPFFELVKQDPRFS
ncbi:MAG: DUF87 domain-containing protein [Akkermansia sp.]|nr:DUF87 domain-containing protein [Akkermansia sp.]